MLLNLNVIKSCATKGQATTFFEQNINVKNSRFKSLNWTPSMTNASTHGRFSNSRVNKGNSWNNKSTLRRNKHNELFSLHNLNRQDTTSLVIPQQTMTHIKRIVRNFIQTRISYTGLDFNGKDMEFICFAEGKGYQRDFSLQR